MSRIFAFTLLAASVALTGCGEKGGEPKSPEAPEAKAPEAKTPEAKAPEVKAPEVKAPGQAGGEPAEAPKDMAGRLKAIEAQTQAAKSSGDFLKIITACGELEIQAAAAGDPIRAQPEFVKICRVAPTKARAALAIAESAAGGPSAHCLSASMNLEELIKAGVEASALTKLLEQVNAACQLD